MTANWKNRLDLRDVFHDEDESLASKTESIVGRIKNAKWYEESNYNGDLEMLLEELTDAANEDDTGWWDTCWSAFYDIADADRILVQTRF